MKILAIFFGEDNFGERAYKIKYISYFMDAITFEGLIKYFTGVIVGLMLDNFIEIFGFVRRGYCRL